MKISKQQAAILQLCDAIELFKKERYISAITLAAASEEVMAQILKQQSIKTGTPHFSAEEIEASLFDMSKEFLGISNYHAYRNRIKNELKHHGDLKNKNVLTGDFKQIALNHVSGAIINYKLIYGKLPNHKGILEFCADIGIS